MSKRLEGGYLGARPSWSLAANPGIWAVEQVYARRVAGTWPVGAGSFDEYYEYVTFLLHANGTNASTSFPDSSLYGRAVTVSGNAQVSTAQSKFGGASIYFDGTGDYLVSGTSTPAFNLSNDFTVEFWVYPTLADAVERTYIHVNAGGAGGVHIHQNGQVLKVDNGLVADYASSNVLTLNQWQHIAVTKQGTTLYIFLNGTLLNSRTAQSYTVSDRCQVGRYSTGGTTSDFAGYIDELRVTNNYARYTSNFTVPTVPGEDEGAPLADPFYNYVSLLLPMNGSNNSTTFTDKSSNALTVTANGDAKISTTQKRYGISSAYFDGTGDYLSVAYASALVPGTSDFTIEFWANLADLNYRFFLGGSLNSGSYLFMAINPTGSGQIWVGRSGTDWPLQFSSHSIQTNTWTHIAVSRSGTSNRCFVNGVQIGSTITDSTNWTLNPAGLWIGAQTGGSSLNGYIDDLRITKGVARYVANFIPPLPHAYYGTLVDPYLGSTSLLMPMEGPNNSTGFFDRADRLPVTTYGNAKISNAQYKWGLTSAYFDGTGDYLQLSSGLDSFKFGTGDFTAEGWVYVTSTSTSMAFWGDIRWAAGYQSGWYVMMSSGGVVRLRYDGTASTWTEIVTGSGAITANTWAHIAIARQSGTIRLFVNGVLLGSASSSKDYQNAEPFKIGTAYVDSLVDYVNGYIDDLRIVKGFARYTTNFTPPTAAFNSDSTSDPYLSNVSLLLKMDGANNSTTFTDSSLTPKAVLAKGNAKISTTQSKFGGSSAYFDGASSTYLAIPAVGLPIGTGDFTIEMWANFTNPSAYQYFCASSSMTGGYFQMALNGMASNAIGIGRTNVDWPLVFSGHNMVANTWYHIAICRANGVARCFVNGSQIGSSITDSTNFTIGVSEFHIGHQDANGTMTGYLDDFRLTNAARYTSNFLPPTISHPVWSQTDANFSSVSLLLNGNGANASTVIADRSTNGLTIVPVDGAQISTAQSRFGGSSLYFDGTLDRLTIAANSSLNFSTGDFTIELWAYHSSFASNRFYISSEATGGLFFGQYTASQIGWGRANVAWDATPSHTMVANTWYHLALTRSGTDMRLFVNGIQIGSTVTNSLAYDLSATATNIGSQAANYYHIGYLDDIRVTKGVARYTAAFTPPVAPHPIPVTDANFGAVSLLLHMNGANASTYFPDHSYNALTVTANGNAQISTAQSKFGGASALFDGTGDDLRIASPSDSLINWYTGDYTLEYWIRCTAFPAASGSGSASIIVGNMSNSADTNYWSFGPIGDGRIRFYYYNGGAVSFTTTSSISLNTWTHLAFVKSGTSMTIYIDGVSSATATVSGTPQSASATGFGIGQYVNVSFNGYIDDLRITKGVARYTANFLLPTIAHPSF